MSRRQIQRDASVVRRERYRELETEGEAQAALWQAIEILQKQGIDVGEKARAVIAKRNAVKESVPK
jgi:hypothetical protein